MVCHFSDTPEFRVSYLRDEDPLGGESFITVTNHLGGVTELRPPAGFYISLTAGPEVNAELPSEAPPEVKRLPTEVAGPWEHDCPGAPEEEMKRCSLPDAR
eukprot:12785991-Alexandrium_andersonii.AAC.1